MPYFQFYSVFLRKSSFFFAFSAQAGQCWIGRLFSAGHRRRCPPAHAAPRSAACLETDVEDGLAPEEHARRLAADGPNRLTPTPRPWQPQPPPPPNPRHYVIAIALLQWSQGGKFGGSPELVFRHECLQGVSDKIVHKSSACHKVPKLNTSHNGIL